MVGLAILEIPQPVDVSPDFQYLILAVFSLYANSYIYLFDMIDCRVPSLVTGFRVTLFPGTVNIYYRPC